MKIKLVDVNSKYPNLALLKLKAYYKAQGYKVGFNIKNPDIVYTSVVFPTENIKLTPDCFKAKKMKTKETINVEKALAEKEAM